MANDKTVLQQKEAALAGVREKRAQLEATIPALNGEAKAKAAQLDAAKLAVFTAAGTPGYEDEIAAGKLVDAAQGALDTVLVERDAAEEQLGLLERAEKQLVAEVGKLQGGLTTARIAAGKATLEKSVAEKAPALGEALRDIVALATVEGSGAVFHDNLLRVIEASTGLDIPKLITEGKLRAHAIRTGKEA